MKELFEQIISNLSLEYNLANHNQQNDKAKCILFAVDRIKEAKRSYSSLKS